jgi:prophage regulatory protein
MSRVPTWVISKAERTAILTERDAKMLASVLGATDPLLLKPVNAKTEPSDFMSITDVASRVGVSEKTITRWCRSGTFPEPVKMGPRLLRWHVSDVDEYLRRFRRSVA